MLGILHFSPKELMEACRLLEVRFTQLKARTSKLLTLLDFEERLKQMETRVEQCGKHDAATRDSVMKRLEPSLL
jgi:hypothetical protein